MMTLASIRVILYWSTSSETRCWSCTVFWKLLKAACRTAGVSWSLSALAAANWAANSALLSFLASSVSVLAHMTAILPVARKNTQPKKSGKKAAQTKSVGTTVSVTLRNPRLIERFNRLRDYMDKDSRFMKFGDMNPSALASLALCEWMELQERKLGVASDTMDPSEDA